MPAALPPGARPSHPCAEPYPDAAPAADHDGRWKDALDAYLRPCLALFWPAVHALIDWTAPVVFLDKELQRLAGALRRGRQHVDKLVEVRLRAGGSAHLLIHVEVQARLDTAFLKRMYTYHCRLWDRYGRHDREVIHVAVLTRSAEQAPTLAFRDVPVHGVAGSAGMEFAVVHLLAWRERQHELLGLARHNPFAVVVLAEIASAATGAPEARLARKTRLLRLLYEHAYDETDVNRLFTFIDGVLTLPRAQARRFNETVDAIEKEYDVAYVTSVERIGMEKGLEQGRLEGRGEGRHEGLRQALSSQLERRFGPLPQDARERVQSASADTLQAWLLRVLDAKALAEVFED